MAEENLSATLIVDAPVDEVFAVLADPTMHAAIDGTGWVREAVDRASLREVGQIFRMDMYHPQHPDGAYRVANKVHVVEPPRALGWLTGEEQGGGELTFGGWFWRYDLAPLGPGRTQVTHTYDWSAVPAHVRAYIDFPPFHPTHLSNSLHHLADLVRQSVRAEQVRRENP